VKRYLLDTHALIWWWKDDPRLSPAARAAMADPATEIFVSPVCGIEIATKVRRGTLELGQPLAEYEHAFAEDGFLHLPINFLHARDAGLLPGEHKDPFDRLIAAQALIENLTVITRDPQIAGFGCRTLW
jgi:PIN domain nuclease of toxin-antitoxin system